MAVLSFLRRKPFLERFARVRQMPGTKGTVFDGRALMDEKLLTGRAIPARKWKIGPTDGADLIAKFTVPTQRSNGHSSDSSPLGSPTPFTSLRSQCFLHFV